MVMKKVFSLLIGLLVGVFILSAKFPVVEYFIREQVVRQEKHDIFALAVAKADAQQVATKREFTDALEALQASLSASKNSLPENSKNTESEVKVYYGRVSSEYRQSENAVNDFRARIEELNGQSEALFTEWETEAKTLPADSEMQARSFADLKKSKAKYAEVYQVLENSLQKSEKTLETFRSYMLAIKHLLNAETIESVDKEYFQLSEDIRSLISQMDTSIQSTQEYLKNK
jgi:chromosome segregation ATPase